MVNKNEFIHKEWMKYQDEKQKRSDLDDDIQDALDGII